jgi:hypothetical protein
VVVMADPEDHEFCLVLAHAPTEPTHSLVGAGHPQGTTSTGRRGRQQPAHGKQPGHRSFYSAPVVSYSSTRACMSAFRSSVGNSRL